ncbi:carbohydrate binding domain-containing protein [bacterium]|nr:carbohydrate binding domain-containing protein [bacterium]
MALGAELVTNGSFTSNTTGWAARNSATLSSESGGQSGNCLKVLENGDDSPGSRQTKAVTAGSIYKYAFYHNDIDGTSDDPTWFIYDVNNTEYILGPTSETASGTWAYVSGIFTVPSGCTSIFLDVHHSATNGDGDAYYFDELSLKQIYPSARDGMFMGMGIEM